MPGRRWRFNEYKCLNHYSSSKYGLTFPCFPRIFWMSITEIFRRGQDGKIQFSFFNAKVKASLRFQVPQKRTFVNELLCFWRFASLAVCHKLHFLLIPLKKLDSTPIFLHCRKDFSGFFVLYEKWFPLYSFEIKQFWLDSRLSSISIHVPCDFYVKFEAARPRGRCCFTSSHCVPIWAKRLATRRGSVFHPCSCPLLERHPPDLQSFSSPWISWLAAPKNHRSSWLPFREVLFCLLLCTLVLSGLSFKTYHTESNHWNELHTATVSLKLVKYFFHSWWWWYLA